MREVDDVLDDATIENFLKVSLAQLAFRAELLFLQRQRLLGLAVEGWVLNEAVDEDEEVVSDLRRLHLELLVLLGEDGGALLDDLVGYVVAVRAASGGADIVDEADLLEAARVGETDADLPSRVDLLIKLDPLLCRLSARLREVEIYVIFKALDLAELLSIQIH